MRYRVRIAHRAAKDIAAAVAWYERQGSRLGIKWFAGIEAAINSLAFQPERCGLAHETDAFAFDLREMLYGSGRRKTHRILYRIEAATVEVIAVRHAAQRDLMPEDVDPELDAPNGPEP